jgi:hypothetical protein
MGSDGFKWDRTGYEVLLPQMTCPSSFFLDFLSKSGIFLIFGSSLMSFDGIGWVLMGYLMSSDEF